MEHFDAPAARVGHAFWTPTLKELSAVDALKAIDAAFEAGKEGELLGASTAPFAAALELSLIHI